ncbi:hypothetical protein CDD81_3443 [Ophiocordyceps australis]|uniref:Protein-arginine deiminase C-terminal domain-containing protein n=1 Tax=Ophiocordyceps australis TaxID=1399860 RepID=A0A2C5Y6C9_9HYPO|nr:hypothetical protein CDD81_3443 [Ophiocordyceps australis]
MKPEIYRVTACMEDRRKSVFISSASPTAVGGQAPFQADIRADTNRDGRVDMDGSSDVEGKHTWTDSVGAIFLSNIGDETGRCRGMARQNMSLDELADCHDANDDVQRAPRYLAPLRTLPISGLNDSAFGTVSVEYSRARDMVRIFQDVGNDTWEIVTNDSRFSKHDIERGLVLGIDARHVRRRHDWDGKVRVDFTVHAANTFSTDSVMLRVAPILIHHHLQPIKTVFRTRFTGTWLYRNQEKTRIEDMFSDMKDAMGKAGLGNKMTVLDTRVPWAQDGFEPGYQIMPGPEGPVSMRIMVEGVQALEEVQYVYTQLRGPGVGAVAAYGTRDPDFEKENLKAGGNMETIPPYEWRGQKYPAGRVIMGGEASQPPQAFDLFAAQETQDPLLLDTTWAATRHIDVVMQFVPSNNARGWKVLVVDANRGRELLQRAKDEGHGNVPLLSRPGPARSGQLVTISEHLNDRDAKEAAQKISKRMDANIRLLKQETGLDDEDIIRLPALFGSYPNVQAFFNETLSRSARKMDAVTPFLFDSYLPTLVNGIPLSSERYLAPKPWGPRVNGRDLFEDEADARYKEAGFKSVDFVDDWGFHSFGGELHCLANTWREVAPWW